MPLKLREAEAKMSPEIHREHGMRFFFFSNEGDEPPHVHVTSM